MHEWKPLDTGTSVAQVTDRITKLAEVNPMLGRGSQPYICPRASLT